MPIAKGLVGLGGIDITTIKVELTDIHAPITWPTDRETELKTEVTGWLKANRIRVSDDPMTVVMREILAWTHTVLLRRSPSAAPEVAYHTVRQQVEDDLGITGAAFDITWCGVANALECALPKHTPDDDG